MQVTSQFFFYSPHFSVCGFFCFFISLWNFFRLFTLSFIIPRSPGYLLSSSKMLIHNRIFRFGNSPEIESSLLTCSIPLTWLSSCVLLLARRVLRQLTAFGTALMLKIPFVELPLSSQWSSLVPPSVAFPPPEGNSLQVPVVVSSSIGHLASRPLTIVSHSHTLNVVPQDSQKVSCVH